MKTSVIVFSLGIASAILALLPALPQTPQAPAPQPPAPAKKAAAPENLPWTRFHPAAAPYQPTPAEKEQIQAKLDELDGKLRELRSTGTDASLLADVEIYGEAARWKMTYPEEFFRARSVADTLNVL